MWSGGMVHSQNSHGSREYSVKLRAYFARPGERLLPSILLRADEVIE